MRVVCVVLWYRCKSWESPWHVAGGFFAAALAGRILNGGGCLRKNLKRSAEFWKGERGLTLIYGWLRDGFSENEIAEKMGIAKSTLDSWRRRHEEIFEAFMWDGDYENYSVEQALYKSAVDGVVSAQTFWLKAKRPGVWNEKKDGGADGAVVEDLSPLADIWKENGEVGG